MSEAPTVWILGAGFSRSLGGPLLDDLLSMRAYAQYEVQLCLDKKRPLRQALALYHFGCGFPEGYLFEQSVSIPRGATFWRNAEEFLEELETFRAPPSGNPVWLSAKASLPVDKLGIDDPFDPDRVREAVLSFVAWQCDFVRRNCPKNLDDWERASPYRDWGALLDQNDTVVTFNYDTTVEELARPDISVRLPQDSGEPEGPELLKLHGSIDWKRGESERVSREKGRVAKPLMATPGNAKLSLKRGGLSPLWKRAATKIEGAESIRWLGYSMPESDASAVETLLTAVVKNRCKELTIDVVLGSPDFRTERLERLLAHAMGAQVDEAVVEELSGAEARRGQLKQDLAQLRDSSNEERSNWVLKIRQLSIDATAPLRAAGLTTYNASVSVLPLFAQDYLRTFALTTLGKEQNASVKKELDELNSNIETMRAQLNDEMKKL